MLAPLAPGTYDLVVTSAGQAILVVTGVVVQDPLVDSSATTLTPIVATLDPPTSATSAVQPGTVNSAVTPIEAPISAQQTSSRGAVLEVASAGADSPTGAFSFTLPLAAPVVAGHGRTRALVLAFVPVLALLASCASVVPSPPGGAGAPAQGRQAPTLADEQKRLAALFQGTPVLFALNGDGSLRVEVPVRFCFDAGRAEVKPPLAAVLDRLARSQRDTMTRFALTAPLDRGSRDAALAQARSDSVQRYLTRRGISASRFLPAGQTISGWIRIVVAA